MVTLEELEESIRAITDRLTWIDKIMKERGAGRDMILAFQCGHSRLYYPHDYVKNWGRLYGIGLGPDVVSEALDSAYDVPPPEITPAIRSIEQIMHPMVHCRAQLDAHLVDKEMYDAGCAVLGIHDAWYQRRAPILRAKQLKHPRGQIAALQTRFEQLRRQIPEVSVWHSP